MQENYKKDAIFPDTTQRLLDIYNRDLKNGAITMADYKIFMPRVDRALLERD